MAMASSPGEHQTLTFFLLQKLMILESEIKDAIISKFSFDFQIVIKH